MKKLLIIGITILISACGQKGNPSERSNDSSSHSDMLARAQMLSEKGFGAVRLSDYGFFKYDLQALKPASDQMLPYELNTPLFTDYADKERFIYLPDSGLMAYRAEEVLYFPEGTTIIKNFLYESAVFEGEQRRHVVETRLLVKENGVWEPRSYVWNEGQTDAFLTVSGAQKQIAFAHDGSVKELNYKVPTVNQCKSCHMLNGEITPIGPTARQLHHADTARSHILQWAKRGLLKNTPSQVPLLARWDDQHASLNDRARAYLDINCGPCHRPGAPGKTSGLNLTVFAKEGYELGIGKKPVAAGKGSGGKAYDIVPGDPESSILVYRMKSTDPGIMMPELGRSSVHTEGVELIEDWIRSMEDKKQISFIFAPNQKD